MLNAHAVTLPAQAYLGGFTVGRDGQRDHGWAARSNVCSVAPGALSALLEEVAHAPSVGLAWQGVLRAGAMIGRFELVREIGRGGFGYVWEARDEELDRSVAFKTIRGAVQTRPWEERLLREAEIAARLDHPNMVKLLEVGRCEHGPYLVLELLRGQTLAGRLGQGPVALPEALRVAMEISRALAHAHDEGVVHRDLKPANVFLCDHGAVKVLDFGLAHAFGTRRVGGGTPAYMAPEQWRGAPEDERTDVFALGVILYEMLTGELPFPSDEGLEVQGALPAPVLEIPGAPALADVIRRMLERDAVGRPRDGAEVLAELTALHRMAEGLPQSRRATPVRTRRPPITPVPRARPLTPRRGRLARRAAVIVAAGLALAVAGVLTARHRPRDWVRPAPIVTQLAVLPFHDVGGGRADEAFSAGLGEMVTNRLRQVEAFRRSLRVVSSSDILKEKVASAKEARAAFGATLALTGSIHWAKNRVTVAANLVDTGSLLVLEARDVEAAREDAATLQQLLVERVAEMLNLQLTPAEAARSLSTDPAPAPGAYAFYLQGRGYLQRYDREENLNSAIAVFDQALSRDPAYALAHAGKAEAYLRRYDVAKDGRFLAKARASARRAVEIDERLAPAHLTMGLVHVAAGEPAEAIRSLQRALDLEPSSPDVHRELAYAYDAAGRLGDAEATYRHTIQLRADWAAYKDLGIFYYQHGRLAEALPMFQRVVELTPDNYVGYANLGGIHVTLGQYDAAVKALERSLALRPTAQAYENLAIVHIFQKRYGEAAASGRKATELDPADSLAWGILGDAKRWGGQREDAAHAYRQAVALLEKQLAVNPRDAETWSRLAMHRADLGARDEALAGIARALRLDPKNGLVLFRSAQIHERAGLRDGALEAVRAALEAGYSREEIGKMPSLEALRRDPRYQALTGPRIPQGSNPK